jgi:hypothetical protein
MQKRGDILRGVIFRPTFAKIFRRLEFYQSDWFFMDL